MQAVILAAGMGRRLGEYTKDNTKCMVSVNGERLVDRVLNQLASLHLDRVIIVVGYKGEELKEYIGNRYDGRIPVEFIDNPVYDKTNNIYSLWLAKERLEEDDTLLLESDLIFEDSLLSLVLDNPYPNLALVAKYETWMDGTVVRLDDDNNIINFIPKKAFKYSEVDLYYKTVNIYKFSREFSRHKYVPFLDAYSKAVGNNEYYEQVLRIITFLDKSDIKALPIGLRKWYEIDDVQDLEIASTLFLDDKARLQNYTHRYGGYWRFPKMLDFCYLVNPYFPPQRMVDEMKSNFDVLLRQYPSGMGCNSLLGGKYFGIRKEYVVVGNGAAELIKALMENLQGRLGVVFPTFQEYPNRLPAGRIEAFTPQNADFSYTALDLQQFFEGKDIQNLLLINPDNPSGSFIPVSDVLKLQQWCEEKGIQLIVDESFVDFTDDFADNSLLSDEILQDCPNLVVMKSISKSYGVPGLRLGVLASSNAELIKSLRHEVAIWNINSFAEFYMQIFNKYEVFYREACQKFVEERKHFLEVLSQVPYLRIIPSQANYFLCQVLPGHTSAQITETLLSNQNILIKDCDNKQGLQGRNYIRIAIRNREDNDRLLAAFLEIK